MTTSTDSDSAPTESQQTPPDKPAEFPMLIDELRLVKTRPTDAVWQWLGRGWADTKACWSVSATYAFLFTLVDFLISFGFYFMDLPYLILPALSGFLLVGPALGVGFYEISRIREAGGKPTLRDALFAYRRNTLGIMGLGVFLVFLFQVWIRLSFTVAALNFPGVSPDWGSIIHRALTTFDGVTFAISITCLGAVFATIIFLGGAFSMPMMVDRRTVLVPSLLTSVVAVSRNRQSCLLWALMIVVFTGIGLITLGFGLILMFPLIGHATWHAYKDVIGAAEASS
ncbi:MAG: DUF2189 domain-containing protein [Rhodospirillales bacterium]